ncbi:hypothetical protein DFH08DRAFT_891645 [Mycena albidolilacea]|uniref:Uncharacterized protein n=1 Tax=Mycena albidolilacea TaxID=1033008 RepID=A0AAD6ZDL8_9AGAR|nr:hypothetical protein DFH08DRAFT_891645 [Mycena albidolilacea]
MWRATSPPNVIRLDRNLIATRGTRPTSVAHYCFTFLCTASVLTQIRPPSIYCLHNSTIFGGNSKTVLALKLPNSSVSAISWVTDGLISATAFLGLATFMTQLFRCFFASARAALMPITPGSSVAFNHVRCGELVPHRHICSRTPRRRSHLRPDGSDLGRSSPRITSHLQPLRNNLPAVAIYISTDRGSDGDSCTQTSWVRLNSTEFRLPRRRAKIFTDAESFVTSIASDAGLRHA